jgi:hypothetical protein
MTAEHVAEFARQTEAWAEEIAAQAHALMLLARQMQIPPAEPPLPDAPEVTE